METLFEGGSDHEQSRDVLRTDLSGKFHRSATQFLPADAEGREAFFRCIVDFRTKCAEGFDKRGDGPLFHALTAGEEESLSDTRGEKSREKAHGGTGRADVEEKRFLRLGITRHFFQRRFHRSGVVTVRKCRERARRITKRTKNECARRDAFTGREGDFRAESTRKLNQHVRWRLNEERKQISGRFRRCIGRFRRSFLVSFSDDANIYRRHRRARGRRGR